METQRILRGMTVLVILQFDLIRALEVFGEEGSPTHPPWSLPPGLELEPIARQRERWWGWGLGDPAVQLQLFPEQAVQMWASSFLSEPQFPRLLKERVSLNYLQGPFQLCDFIKGKNPSL